jgi:hypothetical protein
MKSHGIANEFLHFFCQLSDDAANLLRNLVNSPNSLLLGKGAFFIHVNNMIFQVLKDGATLMSTRLDVQSPRIDYVYPTWFEAGKPVELILCGSSLDQPKFRSKHPPPPLHTHTTTPFDP